MKTRLLCLMLLITTALFSQDITIGTQTWQGANLNVGTMIPNTQAPADNNTVEKYCYGNLETNCTIYGGLYRWDEMMDYTTAEGTQGICGEGYRIPTDADWQTLIDFCGGASKAGQKLKEFGFTSWMWPTQWNWPGYTTSQKAKFATQVQGTNDHGFTAKGSGMLYGLAFYQIGQYGYNWTSTTDASGWIHYIAMNYTSFVAYNYPQYKSRNLAFPVRCIKN